MPVLSIASVYKPQKIKVLTWFNFFFSSPSLHNSRRYLIVGSLCINVLKYDVNTWYKFYKTFPLSVAIHFTHQEWFTGSRRMCHWSKWTVSVSHNVHVIFYFLLVFIRSTPAGTEKKAAKPAQWFSPTHFLHSVFLTEKTSEAPICKSTNIKFI